MMAEQEREDAEDAARRALAAYTGLARDVRSIGLEAVADAARAVQAVAEAYKEYFPNMRYIAGELDVLADALEALDKEA